MTNSVTFPVNLGGDGSTVTDDDNATTGLGNGGHRTRFVPAMGQVVAVANVLTQRLASQSDTSSSSLLIGTGSKSFTTSGFYEWATGMYVLAASAANPANLMYGQVTSWTTATNVLVVNVLSVGGSGTYADWTVSLAGPPNLSTLPAIISVTSTSAALRVTQLGTGDALLIEDSTNPDSTPIVVDQNGNMVNGTTAARVTLSGITPQEQVHGTTDSLANISISRWSANTSPAFLGLAKSRGASPGTYTIVNSGDQLGVLDFLAANGTAMLSAARIVTEVDAAPGAADMPGRMLFLVTADGASTPTEAVRINNNKSVKFSGAGYVANVALTDAATIAWDTNAAQVATFTFVSSSRTMGAPTNLVNGAFYALAVIQNTGSHTLSWNAVFKWASATAPTLSTAAGAKDYFVFRSDGTNLYEQGRSLGVA